MLKIDRFFYGINRWAENNRLLYIVGGSAIVLIIVIFCVYFIFIRDNSQGPEAPVVEKDFLHSLIKRVDSRKSDNVQPRNQNEMIENKIVEIDELRNQLIDKRQDVITLKVQYQHGIDSLKKEIIYEAKLRKLTNFEQAKFFPKISYDISLIQRKGAYINKLMEIEGRLSSGIYQLEYLERQAIDDFYMVNFVQNEAVNDLIKEIDKVIGNYLPDAQKLVISVDVNTMQTPEQIWADILSGSTQEKGN
jgi:hypothetical protein